jgi:tetratricopeptide (TPR) repeat protein
MRRRLVYLALLALLAGTAAAGWYFWRRATSPRPPEADLTGAEPAVAARVEEARAAVLRSPRSARAWGELGMVLRAHEFRAEADVAFAEAERLDPQNPRWPYLRALLVMARDPGAAVPLLRRAAALDGDEPAPRLRYAEELLRGGALAEAEELFRQVLREASDAAASGSPGARAALARARLGLGQVSYQRGDWDACLEHLRQSAAAVPDVQATHSLLAAVYHMRGDAGAAEEERRLAARLPDVPPWPDSYAEEVAEHRVSLEGLLEQSAEQLAQGRVAEAVRSLETAAREHPQSFRPPLALGRLFLQAGQYDRAAAAFEEAARRAPDNSQVLFNSGFALQRLGIERRDNAHFAAAAARYRQALALNPREAMAHLNLGLCLKELGDGDAAIRSFQEAVRHKPDHPGGHKQLGLLLLEAGRSTEARPHLEDAVRLAPSDGEAAELLEKARRQHSGGGP